MKRIYISTDIQNLAEQYRDNLFSDRRRNFRSPIYLLEELYQQIYNNIKKINFDLIWKGFAPTKFALYNETECFFDGKYIEKTSDFVANTDNSFFSRETMAAA